MLEYVLNMKEVCVDTKLRKRVLDIKEFAMKPGELVAVVGTNGSGKSTFLQTINLLKDFRGHINLFGKVVDKKDKTFFRRRSALVFQEMLLLDDSVYNNVAQGLRFRKIPESEIKIKVHKALRDFCCEHLINRSARSLSGGEAQRVCIARAMVTEPELLLLDEPSASLDVSMKVELIQKIKELAEERGISVILVSHNFTDIIHFAKRGVVIFDGRIIQDDKIEILMRKPINKDVAKLVCIDNVISCNIDKVEGKNIIYLEDDINFIYPERLSSKVNAFCISGDCIHIYDKDVRNEKQGWLNLSGIVDEILPDIGSCKIKINLNSQTFIARVLRNNITNEISKGSLVNLAFKFEDMHFI